MFCAIQNNKLSLFIYIIFIKLLTNYYVSSEIFRSYEICDKINGRRFFIESGEKGEINATNITTNNFNKYEKNQKNLVSSVNECSIEFVTCPSCVIKVIISYSNLSENEINNKLCQYEYLSFNEPPYDNEIHSKRICDKTNSIGGYRTKTRTLMIKFVYRKSHLNAFSLNYIAEKNQIKIIGEPENITSSTNEFIQNQIITSPFFPIYYPRDFGIEYVIICKTIQISCRIRVIFTDFQISSTSTVELYDGKSKVWTGTIFRPEIIISSSEQIMIRFFANGGTGLGFRAVINFITFSQSTDVRLKANTNCGGYVENIGGAITMMNLLRNETEITKYDCLWIIKPLNGFTHLKTHLSIRIEAFENMIEPSEIIIKEGITSVQPNLDTITSTITNLTKSKSYVVPLTSGFYVRFKGVFGYNSRLAIVYTAFSKMVDCYIGSEFLCQNQKCIPIQLTCDGFDHCGDQSDELSTCSAELNKKPNNRKWYTPNYYFPKTEQYPDLKTATIVFMISSLGMIFLITALILLLYRMGLKARQQRDLQTRLQTISELLESNRSETPQAIQDELPPEYEEPPTYEEVIKVGMDAEINVKKRIKKYDRAEEKLHLGYQTAVLEVVLPPENSNQINHFNDGNIHNDFFCASQHLEIATTSSSASSSQQQHQQNQPGSTPPPPYIRENTTSSELLDFSDVAVPTMPGDINGLSFTDDDISDEILTTNSNLSSDGQHTENNLWDENKIIKRKSWLKFQNVEDISENDQQLYYSAINMMQKNPSDLNNSVLGHLKISPLTPLSSFSQPVNWNIQEPIFVNNFEELELFYRENKICKICFSNIIEENVENTNQICSLCILNTKCASTNPFLSEICIKNELNKNKFPIVLSNFSSDTNQNYRKVERSSSAEFLIQQNKNVFAYYQKPTYRSESDIIDIDFIGEDQSSRENQ